MLKNFLAPFSVALLFLNCTASKNHEEESYSAIKSEYLDSWHPEFKIKNETKHDVTYTPKEINDFMYLYYKNYTEEGITKEGYDYEPAADPRFEKYPTDPNCRSLADINESVLKNPNASSTTQKIGGQVKNLFTYLTNQGIADAKKCMCSKIKTSIKDIEGSLENFVANENNKTKIYDWITQQYVFLGSFAVAKIPSKRMGGGVELVWDLWNQSFGVFRYHDQSVNGNLLRLNMGLYAGMASGPKTEDGRERQLNRAWTRWFVRKKHNLALPFELVNFSGSLFGSFPGSDFNPKVTPWKQLDFKEVALPPDAIVGGSIELSAGFRVGTKDAVKAALLLVSPGLSTVVGVIWPEFNVAWYEHWPEQTRTIGEFSLFNSSPFTEWDEEMELYKMKGRSELKKSINLVLHMISKGVPPPMALQAIPVGVVKDLSNENSKDVADIIDDWCN